MPISSGLRAVFGHFQNLNLLGLLEDLRTGRTTRQAWFTGANLCPVAHGLATGQHVRQMAVLGQDDDLEYGCYYAARCLGADFSDVLRFVRAWDEETMSTGWLLRQLQELWEERLADAVAVQELLQACPGQERRRSDQPCTAGGWIP